MFLSSYPDERGGISEWPNVEFCDKGVVFGIRVSHLTAAPTVLEPNVKRVKAIVNGTPKHVSMCAPDARSGKVTRAV